MTRPDAAREERILVIGPSWVGDMVMAQSLFMALLERFPGARIDVLAPGWSLPLLTRMPQVHAGIEMPLGHGEFGFALRWRIARALRREGYTRAVVLPGSWKSALIPFLAGIARRTGWRGEMRYGLLNDIRLLDKARLPMTVQRFVALAWPAHSEPPPVEPSAGEAAGGLPAAHPPRLNVDVANQERLRRDMGLATGRPVVAFMPGAEYGPAKQWPLPHFARLASQLIAGGATVWVLGSARDYAAGQRIVEGLPAEHALNLCGRTRLEDAVDLLALCRAAVTNDSGLMHVAAALDLPLVALFGSSSPEHTPPLSARARVLYLGLDCSPCFARECPLGHTRCLAEISPARVLDTLENLGVFQPEATA